MTTATKRSRAVETLVALETQHGQLQPELVVEEARDPASPLHPYFLWDDEAAGHAWRVEQARQLIRSVRVEITVQRRTINAVQYVHDQRVQTRESMYVNIEHVTEDSLIQETLDDEFERISGAIERAIGIAQTLDRERDFRARLRTLLR
jgi:hypothetical protein